MPIMRTLWLENVMNATDIYTDIRISTLAKQAPAQALNGTALKTLWK